MPSLNDRFRGLILGAAVGDSVGLPAEGLSRERTKLFFKGDWKQRFILGNGMISDDTEHTIFVAQALVKHSDSPGAFARRLAWSLRLWLASFPAGVGLATARAILKLWVGVPATKSGVFSAGNGAAMRVASIGAYFFDDSEQLEVFTKRATGITHSDPKALYGAQAVARVAAWIVRDDLSQRPNLQMFMELLGSISKDSEWSRLVASIQVGLENEISVSEFAESLGLSTGVTGYVYHTVPVCLFAWYRHFGNFERTMVSVLDCGGDTDTTGAIVGAMAGATVGEQGIPDKWLSNIAEWPRTTTYMRHIADALADKRNGSDVMPTSCFWPALPLRNLFFLVIVLMHGVRRLLSPY